MVDVPLVFVQVLIFDVVVYFMANLQRTASQFFISLLFLFFLVSSNSAHLPLDGMLTHADHDNVCLLPLYRRSGR